MCALVTGVQTCALPICVPDDVAQALRDSGLTHLLTISGLHVTAVVGFVMIATRRLLALSMHAATHWHLSLIGAIAAAGAGVGYSLLEIGRASCRERVCQYV